MVQVGTDSAKAAKEEGVRKARAAFRAVGESFEDVKQVHADYRQLQESLLLAEPIETLGKLFLRADPGCMVLRIDRPTPVQIRSDETTHQIYHPEDRRAERFIFKKNRLASALISCLQADLEKVEEVFIIESFRLVPVDEDEEAGEKSKAVKQNAVVVLTPKDKNLRDALRELRVEFDLDAALPVSIEQINREGERVRFELSKVELFKEPSKDSESIFDLPLPRGTRVVETVVKETDGGDPGKK